MSQFTMAIKVSIYEDNALQLERLSHLIRGVKGLELCAVSTDAANIVDDCKRWHPDAILMGIDTMNYLIKPGNGDMQDKYNLTKREREVLQRLLMGDSYKMIAQAFFISIGTVYSHINNIYKKLQINSKSEAVIKAIREGLV
jgi:DNA-binding NarL/FixJ family response regulator